MRRNLRWLGAIILWCGLSAVASAQDLTEMAGQMILVGFQGDSVDDAGVAAVRDDIAAGRVGGVMYLRTNVASLAAVRDMNAGFVAAGAVVPFIAIDQEGGLVERLTEAVGFTEVPSAERMAASDPQAAMRTYADLGARLHGVGFNLNFGPVVDLAVNPDNPVIVRHGRSFGSDSMTVSEFAGAFVMGHRNSGVLTALKHFPGHGSSAADSHEGFTDVSTSWAEAELDPFRRLKNNGLIDMIMSGHLYNPAYRPGAAGGEFPASLSQFWIQTVLRDEMGFDGVVISDDMEMGAIRQNYAFADAIRMAVMAGTDILLFSNTADARTSLATEIQAILVAEAEANPNFRRRIEESYQRIMSLKATL